jgi:hypothetical protein
VISAYTESKQAALGEPRSIDKEFRGSSRKRSLFHALRDIVDNDTYDEEDHASEQQVEYLLISREIGRWHRQILVQLLKCKQPDDAIMNLYYGIPCYIPRRICRL